MFLLFSFLLFFRVTALGLRVTEEGLSGIDLGMVCGYLERHKIPYVSIGSTCILDYVHPRASVFVLLSSVANSLEYGSCFP